MDYRTQIRRSSDETTEIPRSFPPPGYELDGKTAQSGYLTTNGHPPSGLVYSASLAPFLSPARSSPTPNIISSQRRTPRYLDGHTSSADCGERRDYPKSPGIDIPLRHYCAKCGRSRSKRYHIENPFKKGTIPVPGVCSRCTLPKPTIAPDKKANNATDEKQVEELLIRRGRPHSNPIVRIFQPCSTEVVQITRRRRSSGRRSSSDGVGRPSSGIQKDFTRRKQVSVESRETEASPSTMPAGTRSYYVSQVRTGAKDQSSSETEAINRKIFVKSSTNYRRNADDLIASHPNPWSHGRMITVDSSQPKYSDDNDRSSYAPEWYYRQYRAYVIPKPSPEPKVKGNARLRRIYDDKRSPDQHQSRRPERPRVSRSPPGTSATREIPPDSRGSSRNLRYEKLDGFRRRCRCRSSSSDSFDKPHVKFVDSAKERKILSRNNEAMKDRIEEEIDQHDYEKVKRRVRKDVQHGAGAFELDGCSSEASDAKSAKDNETTQYSYDAICANEQSQALIRRSGVTHVTHCRSLAGDSDAATVSSSEGWSTDAQRNGEEAESKTTSSEHKRSSCSTEELSHVFERASIDSNGQRVSDAWQAEAKVVEFKNPL